MKKWVCAVLTGFVLAISVGISPASAADCGQLFQEAKTKFKALAKEGKLDADKMIQVNDLMTEGNTLCREGKASEAVSKLVQAIKLL